MNALTASLHGIQSAERQIEGVASRVSKMSVPGESVDLVTDMVSLTMAKTQLKASVVVARTASETQKRLLDTFA